MDKVSAAQIKALNWVQSRGGNCVVDKRGRLLAQGDTYPACYSHTVLRMLGSGLFYIDNGRLNISKSGYFALDE